MEQVGTSDTAGSGASRDDEARRLAAARRRLFLASTAVGLVTLWVLWATGVAAWTWRAVSSTGLNEILSVWLYGVILLGVFSAIAFPFSWARGYHLAHRFGLSRQTLRAWMSDWLKAMLLSLLFGSLIVLLLYGALWLAGPSWWLVFGTVMTGATIFISFVAPYVLVPIFYRMQPVEDPGVSESIRRLSVNAGAVVREVCVLDFSRKTGEANAAVIGLGRSRRVVLADTLLSHFSLPEISSVVAHELGHHVHGDMLKLLAVQTALLWGGLALANGPGGPLLAATGAGGLADPGSLPLLLLGAELFSLATMPLANALSRRMERSADLFALRLTGDPLAFASAMRKLAQQNLAELQPPRWAEVLLATHPPIGRRIQLAEAIARARN